MLSDLHPYYKPHELKRFRLIGWYQIAGGAIGTIYLLWLLAQNTSLLMTISVLIGISLYILSIYAGRQLLNEGQLKSTYLVQTLQILNFVGLGITYQVGIGLLLSLGFEWIDTVKIVFNTNLNWFYEFSYTPSQTDAIRVVVNFVPVLIISYLMKCRERAEERKHLTRYRTEES